MCATRLAVVSPETELSIGCIRLRTGAEQAQPIVVWSKPPGLHKKTLPHLLRIRPWRPTEYTLAPSGSVAFERSVMAFYSKDAPKSIQPGRSVLQGSIVGSTLTRWCRIDQLSSQG
jgi:hypothetical protein